MNPFLSPAVTKHNVSGFAFPLKGTRYIPVQYEPVTQQLIILLIHPAFAPKSTLQSCSFVVMHTFNVGKRGTLRRAAVCLEKFPEKFDSIPHLGLGLCDCTVSWVTNQYSLLHSALFLSVWLQLCKMEEKRKEISQAFNPVIQKQRRKPWLIKRL